MIAPAFLLPNSASFLFQIYCSQEHFLIKLPYTNLYLRAYFLERLTCDTNIFSLKTMNTFYKYCISWGEFLLCD